MKLTLTRLVDIDGCTLGVLAHENNLLCFTLENPWLDNKINVSCIPEGCYKCEPHDGSKFEDTWLVKDVPGRSGIVFHTGNTASDTKGCILPGTTIGSYQGKRAVLSSGRALTKLRDYIHRRNSFDLHIKGVE